MKPVKPPPPLRSRGDVVAAVPIPREAWERAQGTELGRAQLQAQIGDALLTVAARLAATRALEIDTLTAVDARPADETEELELLGAEVAADPAAYVVVRGRFSTTPARTRNERGDRVITIPVGRRPTPSS